MTEQVFLNLPATWEAESLLASWLSNSVVHWVLRALRAFFPPFFFWAELSPDGVFSLPIPVNLLSHISSIYQTAVFILWSHNDLCLVSGLLHRADCVGVTTIAHISESLSLVCSAEPLGSTSRLLSVVVLRWCDTWSEEPSVACKNEWDCTFNWKNKSFLFPGCKGFHLVLCFARHIL